MLFYGFLEKNSGIQINATQQPTIPLRSTNILIKVIVIEFCSYNYLITPVCPTDTFYIRFDIGAKLVVCLIYDTVVYNFCISYIRSIFRDFLQIHCH